MVDSAHVKSLVLASGADLCGIAPASRFKGAPDGFRPTDIYPGCRSVLVFARKVPSSERRPPPLGGGSQAAPIGWRPPASWVWPSGQTKDSADLWSASLGIA